MGHIQLQQFLQLWNCSKELVLIEAVSGIEGFWPNTLFPGA